MTSAHHRTPPRLARALATWLLRGDAREVIVGDLDQEFAESAAAGVPIGAARRRYWRQALASIVAVRRPERASDDDHPGTGRGVLDGLRLDLTSVTRALRRSPGYAAVAVTSLAIGIGANTAMFSVVRQLLYRPLPVDRPDELRHVYWSATPDGPFTFSQINSGRYTDANGVSSRSNFSYPLFAAMRDAARQDGVSLCGYNRVGKLTMSSDRAGSLATAGLLVSGNFFATIGVAIAVGRPLDERDDQPGAPAVAVISSGLWTRAFGGRPDVIGLHVRVNDAVVEIVGVTAAAWHGLSPGGFAAEPEITLTLAQQPAITPEWSLGWQPFAVEPMAYWVRAIARVPAEKVAPVDAALRHVLVTTLPNGGVTPAQASTVTARLLPAARGSDSLRTSTAPPLQFLAVVVGIVLFLACVNVAGLMLARGVSRQREIAVRRALGASRARLIRELLLESVLLSAAGGIAGVLLAIWSAPVIATLLSSGLGTSHVTVAVDVTLLAAAAGLAVAAGVAAGLIPAIRFSRSDALLLRDRAVGTSAPRLRIGRVLLALQIAVSLPLVAGAGLFLRTLHNLGRVDLGFNPDDVVLFSVDPTLNGRKPERAELVYPALLRAIEAVPGVTAATLLENALISGIESDSNVSVDGLKSQMYMNLVGPRYFETMGVPLLAGRAPNESDRAGGQRVAVINQRAAAKLFKTPLPLGRHFLAGTRDYEVIGVMADAKYDALRNDVPPTMVHFYGQRFAHHTEASTVGGMTVAVRAAGAAAELRRAIEQAVHDVDPALPVTAFRTQTEQIDETIGRERTFARLLTAFGGFALLLACIGLHGVTSYSVARRTSEIGIRLALGARRSQVLWLVLRQVVVLALAGLAIGVPVAWLAGPVVRAFLFGLEPNDPVTIIGSAFVLFGVAILAGLWPARRAARLEALTALRTE